MAFRLSDMEPYFRSFVASCDSDEALYSAVEELRAWVLALLDGDFLLNEKALSTNQVFGDVSIVAYLFTTAKNISNEERQQSAYDTAKDIVDHLKNQARARRLNQNSIPLSS